MDQYFPVISKGSTLRKSNEKKLKKRANVKYQPYQRSKDGDGDEGNKLEEFREQLRQRETKASSSEITKFLLGNLSDESNPITYSDLRERSDHIVSTSTGHQVDDVQRGRKLWTKEREQKLSVQRDAKFKGEDQRVLSNVRVYIDGFLENTTDIVMKRTVIQAGGQVVATASGCTHILTSQPLSGSKTHKLLTTKSRNKIHVVKPEWISDSIETGKRQPERKYAIIKSAGTKTLYDMLEK